MEIGDTGYHGQAAQRAVVVASKLVLDNAIILLQKMVGGIAVAVMRKVLRAVHKLVQVITIANYYFIVDPVEIIFNFFTHNTLIILMFRII